jgi:hypothetical protein
MDDLLEIDDDLFKKENLNKVYKNKSIYIIHYPKGKQAKLSNDIIKGISYENNRIEHLGSTEDGSSGAPILNLQTFKVIGIHLGKYRENNWNIGEVIRSPIDEFNKLYFEPNLKNEKKEKKEINKNIEKNEIILSIKIEKEMINEKIFFLDNHKDFNNDFDPEEFKRDFCNLELNENNIKIYINNKPYKFCNFFIPEIEGIYKIKIELNNQIDDCSFMFYK